MQLVSVSWEIPVTRLPNFINHCASPKREWNTPWGELMSLHCEVRCVRVMLVLFRNSKHILKAKLAVIWARIVYLWAWKQRMSEKLASHYDPL